MRNRMRKREGSDVGSLLLRLGRTLRLGCGAGLSVVLIGPAQGAGSVPTSGTILAYVCQNNCSLSPTILFDSPMAACVAAAAAKSPADPVYHYTATGFAGTAGVVGGGGDCIMTRFVDADGSVSTTNYRQTQWNQPGANYTLPGCPAHSLAIEGSCSCDVDYRPNGAGTACEGYTCTPGGQAGGPGVYERVTLPGNTNPGANSCASSYCLVRGTYTGTQQDGRIFEWGPLTQVGGFTCDTPNLASPPASSASAPAPSVNLPGSCMGVVGGVTTITPCASSSSTTTQQTTSTPTSASGVAGNPTTTTTSTTTTCTNGVCTTTENTRTTNPDGSTTIGNSSTSGPQNPTGPTAPGSGGGSGSGGGGTGCQANPSGAGCGGTPGSIGELYTPKTDTLQGVMSSFRDQALQTPMGNAVGGFFTVSGGGSCPTWSGTIPYIDYAYTIDQFCSDFAGTALLLLRACMLVLCSFFAFRVAIDN